MKNQTIFDKKILQGSFENKEGQKRFQKVLDILSQCHFIEKKNNKNFRIKKDLLSIF